MSKLKIGVIGCGGIANGKHLPALSRQSDRVELVAFCDIIVERAEQAAKTYGVEGAKVYADYHDLLEDKSIDVVHVCTPNRSHCEISVAALEAGKHVMCEKPMAKTVADARKMLDAAKKSGKKLTIGYQNRQLDQNRYLKQEALAGTFGQIYYSRAVALRRRAVPTWGVFLNEEEQGGGPLIDIGTHALDLTLWMMDNYKPKYCIGTTYHKLFDKLPTGNAWGDWQPEKFTVEDRAFGMRVRENGATIMLESSWALNTLDVREAQTTLCGTLGGADMIGGLRINKVDLGCQTTITPNLSAGGVAFYEGAGALKDSDLECKLWIDSILEDKAPVVLPEQAFAVTQILEAIYTSSKTGEAVYFK